MVNCSGKKLTDLADEFLLPSNPTHRQYEALRTFFVDRAPSAEAAERFGYTPGSFRVLCHEFRKNPQREFFLPQTKKAKLPPPRERLRQKIITLRKQNSSVYDIRDALDQSGEKLSPASISTILKEEGFARLPRRRDDERPATTRPNAADVADAGKLDKLIDRYAQRMLIENGIADGIDFFHMDALSSAVAMKVNCDLQLTLMASSLYRLLGTELGKEYTNAKSRRIFRDFIDATAVVTIDSSTITVQFQKRAHNPHLLEAGFDRKRTRVPWLGGRHLQLIFG